MFVIRIWNYFRGYAIIIVKGLKIERFINLALVNNIYIWDIKRINCTTIKAKIGLENFSRLREIVRKTNSSIEIEQKCGLPFAIKKVRRKKLFFSGILTVFVLVYILSSHIWMIEVTGIKTLDKNVILKYLYEEGLREGTRKGNIDKRAIENSMLINMSELAWIGIQIKGTKAFIEIVEKKEAPTIVSKDEYCDIVAAKDGVISKLLVLNGDGMVKDGSTVKKGQLLVAGTIVRENTDVRFVHSMAQVMARTWYEDAEEIPLTQKEYRNTGKSAVHYSLKILDKCFFKNRKIPFEEYNEYAEEKNLLSFGDYVFPIKLLKTKYVELNTITKNLSVDEAKKRCEERLNAKIKLQLPEKAVILDKKIDYYVDEKSVKAKISIEVLEDIGVKKKIDTNVNAH